MPTISLSVNVLSQSLGILVQGLNATMHMVPDKYKPYVALAVGIAQALVAFLAHYSPPPGSA